MEPTLYHNFFALIRAGIGNAQSNHFSGVDWLAIQDLALQQGLYAVVLDGIEKLPEKYRPKQELLLEWIGEVLQGYEYRYDAYKKTIAEMAGFYNQHGYKMMVLKGYACSLDWPRPEHRPCGDIDIWQFGKQKEADALFAEEKGIEIDNSHHHHTVFEWKGFTVENHYDFVNVHHSKSNRSIERVFKKLGEDDTHFVEVCGAKVYIPSPNLTALFLLRHSMIEFVASSISLRQVLDWAFFVKNHTKEIDWDWLHHVLDEYHMRDFYNYLNAICVEDLGFESTIFQQVQFSPYQKDLVLAEILNPAIPNEKPAGLISRVMWKIRRWKANEWKHKLCYEESLWSSFCHGVWNHLLKPSSI